MMNAHFIRDYQAHFQLQAKLGSIPTARRTAPIKRLLTCTTNARHTGVTIVKNDKGKVAFNGLIYCHNEWCCPLCAPYRLSILKKRIELAFKMEAERNLKCCMLTLTIPHVGFNERRNVINENTEDTTTSLATLLYVLKNSLKDFQTRPIYCTKKRKADCLYMTEITYSRYNGWHPHYHILIWLTPEQFETFTALEEEYQKVWKRIIKKHVEEITWNETEKNGLLNVLEYSKEAGLFFSKDKNGKAREIVQSNYFWSGENEIADLTKKKAKNGHYTQWQILARALDQNDSQCNFFWNKYLEVVNAVYRLNHHRFSPNFLQRIKEYEAEHVELEEVYVVKKKEDQVSKILSNHIVIGWLSQFQWNFLRHHLKERLTLLIVSFSLQDNAFQLLEELCEVYNLPPPMKEPPFDIKTTVKVKVEAA